jgi:hypothetical protein
MNQDFNKRLNASTQEQLLLNNAFFMKNNDSPCYIVDTLQQELFASENWTALQINNDKLKKDFSQYASQDLIIEKKPHWLENLSQLPPNKKPQSIPLLIENNLRMYAPTALFNQDVVQDNPKNQKPIPYYVPYQSKSPQYRNVEEFLTEQLENYYNAAYTKTPYFANTDYKDAVSKVITKISVDPEFISRCSKAANEEVTNYHYIPINKNSFINNARDFNTSEFNQLNKAIAKHLCDIYINTKPSFNNDFNGLSKNFINSIFVSPAKNKVHLIKTETPGFIKKNIKEDKPASILVDTYLGTIIDKIKNIPIKTKKIAASLIIATSLMGLPVANNLQAETPNGNNTTIIYSLQPTETGQFALTNRDMITINNKTIRGAELQKIIDFDNNPFDLNNDGKINATDYRLARQIENVIIKTKYRSSSQQQKYLHDQELAQVSSFTQKISEKYDLSSSLNVPATLSLIFGNIATNLQNNGDNVLMQSTQDPRTFFSYLNYQINRNPQLIDQAIAILDHKTATPTHRASVSRR